MKTIIVNLLFISFFCLSSCSNNDFEGKWEFSNEIKLSFSGENKFEWKTKNDNINFHGTYKIHHDPDYITLNTQHDFSLSFLFQNKDNWLILWNYKGNNKETAGHIDEIYPFTREGYQINNSVYKHEKEIFKLPSNYIGDIFVSYNQSGSKNSFRDDKNNYHIIIPDNGLSKTDLEESVLDFAFGAYEFNYPHKKIPFFIDDLVNDSLLKLLNHDSIYACVYGYNQIGRKRINKLYGEQIKGNVLMIEVDTLKNILKTRDLY